METKRFNPLTAGVAVGAIVVAAIGVSAATGMVTSSRDNEMELPKEVVQPVAPAISHPVSKPVARPAVRKTASRPAPVVQAPKPALGQLAVVESVREVREPGEAKGVGAVAGGVAGGVLGHKLGKGKGIVTVVGAAAGAFGGHQIEKQVRAEKHWETSIRLDDGTQRTLSSEAQPAWRAGERVRLVDGELRAA